jgi:hypothetical protein
MDPSDDIYLPTISSQDPWEVEMEREEESHKKSAEVVNQLEKDHKGDRTIDWPCMKGMSDVMELWGKIHYQSDIQLLSVTIPPPFSKSVAYLSRKMQHKLYEYYELFDRCLRDLKISAFALSRQIEMISHEVDTIQRHLLPHELAFLKEENKFITSVLSDLKDLHLGDWFRELSKVTGKRVQHCRLLCNVFLQRRIVSHEEMKIDEISSNNKI